MDEKQAVKGKIRKLKWYHILILILFVFLVTGLFIRFRSNTKSRLRAKIDELHAKGYPVTLKELDQSYSIPDNVENAADFILDAIAYYNEPNDPGLLDIIHDWAKLSPQGEPLSDEIIKHAVSYLNDNKKSLELLHKAATLKYCRYPINISAGQHPNLLNMGEIIKTLDFEAIVNAVNGDNQASVNALIYSLNITDSLANIPFLICQLARSSYYELIYQTLEYIINTTDFTDEQLNQLSKAIADKQRLSGISYGFTGELCSAISVFEDITTSNNIFRDLSFSQRLFYSAYRSFGLIESDGIIYLDIINKYIEAGKLPLEKRLNAAKQIQAEINNISNIHVRVKATAPNYNKIFSGELVSISKLRAAQAALAVQRYRLKNGKLPDSLSNFVPEFLETIPLDPFDGKELRYKKLDSGFVTYSVDQDLIDDGGREQPKDKRQKVPHWDITFTIKK